MFAIKKTDEFGNISYFWGLDQTINGYDLDCSLEWVARFTSVRQQFQIMLYSDEEIALSRIPIIQATGVKDKLEVVKI